MGDEPKPFLEHLEEMRWTIIRCLVSLVIGLVIAFCFVRKILAVVQAPLFRILEERGEDPEKFLFVLNVIDPLTISIQTGMLAGFIIACPAIFYYIGIFLLPALSERERGMLVPAFAAGAGLFLTGVVFCYFAVMPTALNFFIGWAEWIGGEARWPLQNYVGFFLQMLLAFGISFEMPLVIVILAQLGIVSRRFLADYRRHAFVIILTFSALITPTTDPFSLFMLAGPMYLLYEASIFLTGVIERRRAAVVVDGG